MNYEKIFFEMVLDMLNIAKDKKDIGLAEEICQFLERKIEDPETIIKFARRLLKEFKKMPTINDWVADFLEKKALEGAKAIKELQDVYVQIEIERIEERERSKEEEEQQQE